MLPRHRKASQGTGRGEAELVSDARSGDRGAAEELCGRHLHSVWRAAYAICGQRDMADDAVQECFEHVLKNLDRFELGRPLSPWIHRITVNCALDQLRRRPMHQELEEAIEPVGGEENPVGEREELVTALSKLSMEQRTVVVARVLLDHSANEVAEVLNIPVGTVHSRLARGLDGLRVSLLEVADG